MELECRHIRSKFTAHVDGDLSPGEARVVAQHVARCPQCASELAEVRRFLELCHEFVVCPAPAYSFEALRRRMALVEPLEEIVAFLPKLRINATIPRFAVAMLMMFIVGGTPFTLRNTRNAYLAMRTPFAQRLDQVDDKYQDQLDAQYRQQVLGGRDSGGAGHSRV